MKDISFLNNLELYLSFIATILGLLITTITFLVKFIKNAKGKKVAYNLIKISEVLIPLIEEAESFINYTGTEKKAYVMTRVKEYAVSNKIRLDNKSNLIDEKIEEIVLLTKQVNYLKAKDESVNCFHPADRLTSKMLKNVNEVYDC